jgi:hypothetical protein
MIMLQVKLHICVMTLVLLISAGTGYAQSTAISTPEIRSMLLKVKEWRADINCGDSAYWDIVRLDKAAIPALITLVADSSKLAINKPCTQDEMALGDLSLKILDEIITLPLYEITHVQMCWGGGECDMGFSLKYLEFVANDRMRFATQVREWFEQNHDQIRTKRLPKQAHYDCRRSAGIDHQLVIRR